MYVCPLHHIFCADNDRGELLVYFNQHCVQGGKLDANSSDASVPFPTNFGQKGLRHCFRLCTLVSALSSDIRLVPPMRCDTFICCVARNSISSKLVPNCNRAANSWAVSGMSG